MRGTREGGRRPVPRAHHDETQTALRNTIVGSVEYPENNVISETADVFEKLTNSGSRLFVGGKWRYIAVTVLPVGIVALQVPVFPWTVGNAPMAKCSGREVGNVFEKEVARRHLANEAKVFVDQVAPWVGERGAFTTGRKALAGRAAYHHMHVAVEVPIATELGGRQVDDALGDELQAGPIDPNRIAALLVDFIAKSGKKASLLKTKIQTHCT